MNAEPTEGSMTLHSGPYLVPLSLAPMEPHLRRLLDEYEDGERLLLSAEALRKWSVEQIRDAVFAEGFTAPASSFGVCAATCDPSSALAHKSLSELWHELHQMRLRVAALEEKTKPEALAETVMNAPLATIAANPIIWHNFPTGRPTAAEKEELRRAFGEALNGLDPGERRKDTAHPVPCEPHAFDAEEEAPGHACNSFGHVGPGIHMRCDLPSGHQGDHRATRQGIVYEWDDDMEKRNLLIKNVSRERGHLTADEYGTLGYGTPLKLADYSVVNGLPCALLRDVPIQGSRTGWIELSELLAIGKDECLAVMDDKNNLLVFMPNTTAQSPETAKDTQDCACPKDQLLTGGCTCGAITRYRPD